MTRVHVEDHFEEYGRKFDDALRNGLYQGGLATKQIAERNAPRGATGRLASRIHATPPMPTPTGWRVIVYAGMFYGRFLEFGTLGGRKRQLRQPDRRRLDASPGTGMAARYWMLRSGREGAALFAAAIELAVRRMDT